MFPARLEVRITERAPFARVASGDRNYLIDGSGRVLAAVAAERDAVAAARRRRRRRRARRRRCSRCFVRLPALAERFEIAERVGGRRWTLQLDGGVTVQLPAEGDAEALARRAAHAGARAGARARSICGSPAARCMRKRPGAVTVAGQLAGRARRCRRHLSERRSASREQRVSDGRQADDVIGAARHRHEQDRLHHLPRSIRRGGRGPVAVRVLGIGCTALARPEGRRSSSTLDEAEQTVRAAIGAGRAHGAA